MEQHVSSREQTIIRLDFNTKVRLAWQLSRACGLPYFALFSGILLLIIFLQTAIYIAEPNSILQIIPGLLYFGLFAVCLGVCRSALLYMDGKENSFRWTTILEPVSRPVATLPLVTILTALFMLTQLYMFIPLSDSAILALALIALPLLLLLEYHCYYAAENTSANALEILTRPFGLIKCSPKIWLSGCAGYGLSYLVLIIVAFPAGIIVNLVDMLSNPGMFFNFDSQSYFHIPAMLTGSLAPVQFVVRAAYIFFVFLVTAATMVFNTFIFAIAYKQSILIFKSGAVNKSGRP